MVHVVFLMRVVLGLRTHHHQIAGQTPRAPHMLARDFAHELDDDLRTNTPKSHHCTLRDVNARARYACMYVCVYVRMPGYP